MNMSRLTAIAVMAALFTASAAAETVKRGLVACVSEDILDEAMSYSAKRDNNGLMQLLASGKCDILKQGDQVTVISSGFSVATIRHRGTRLYTPSEAVR